MNEEILEEPVFKENIIIDEVDNFTEADDIEEYEDYALDPRFVGMAQRAHSEDGLLNEDIDAIADLALEVIRTILESFDASDAEISEYEGTAGELIFDISNADLAILIGRHGKMLDMFQFMVSTIINRKIGFRFPVVIDVEGYKNRRKLKLETMAHNAARKAVQQRAPFKMHPMSAYERRLIHIMLRNDKRVKTYSEGQEPERCIVIEPVDCRS